eukprot:scaffold2465_cov93-Skeletonema_dohrnii-CCMP3373.AAC.2
MPSGFRKKSLQLDICHIERKRTASHLFELLQMCRLSWIFVPGTEKGAAARVKCEDAHLILAAPHSRTGWRAGQTPLLAGQPIRPPKIPQRIRTRRTGHLAVPPVALQKSMATLN